MIMAPSQLSCWAVFCNCFYPDFNKSSQKQMVSIQQWSACLGYISLGAMLYIPLIISFVKNGAPTIHPQYNLLNGETTIIIPDKTMSLLSFDKGLFWVVLFCLLMFLIPLLTFLMFLSLSCSNYDNPKRMSHCGVFLTEFFGRLTVCVCFVSPIIACLSAINLTTYYVSDTPQLRVIFFIISWLALAISVFLFWPLGFFTNQFIHLFQGAVSYYQLMDDFQNRHRLVTPGVSAHSLGECIYPISNKSFRDIIAYYKRCMACFAFVEIAALLYLPCAALFIKHGSPTVHPNIRILDQPSFVPEMTNDLRSFDRGLFWVTLWGIWMLLIPTFTINLVFSLCGTYCHNLKTKNNCAICVTGFFGQLVLYISIFSPLFASLSGANFIIYYTADTRGFYIVLIIVAWLGLLLSLLIYLPLAFHIYSFTQFFRASIAYHQLSDKINWETDAVLPEESTTPFEENISPRITDFYNESKPLI